MALTPTALWPLDPVARRGALALAAGAAPLLAAATRAAAVFDTADPFANLKAYVKLVSTLGERPTFSVYTGQCYARIGERLTPLFGYGGYALNQARVAPGNMVELRGKEVAFTLDAATGDVIDRWQNPFTGERVDVVHMINPGYYAKLGPEWPASGFTGGGENRHTALWAVDVATVQNAAGMAAGAAATKPFLLPWTRIGGAYATALTMSVRKANPVTPDKWPKASTGPTVESHESFVLYGEAAALDDDARPHAMATGSLTRHSPWAPFMRMGQSGVVGGLVTSCHLYKVAEIDDLPLGIRGHVEKRHPDMLAPYETWTPPPGELVTGWSAYARTVPPEVR